MVVISTKNWENLPTSSKVEIAGVWSNWTPTPCQQGDNGVWKLDITLSPGTYEYKYLINEEWLDNPNEETHRDASGTINNVLKVYNAGWKFAEPITFEVEKKGSVIGVACDDEIIVTGHSDWEGQAKVWDLETGELKYTMLCNKLGNTPAPFSHDSIQMSLGKNVIGTLSTNDHTVSIWDKKDGTCLYKKIHHGQYVNVYGIAVTDDYVLSGAEDGSLIFMENVGGEWKITHKSEENKDGITHIAADGKWAVTGHRNTMKLWDLEERKMVETPNEVSIKCGMVVLNYPFAFAIGEWNGVQVWDMEKGVQIRHILEYEKGYQFISSNCKLLTFSEAVNSWSSGDDDGRMLKLGVYDIRQLGDPEIESENLWTKTFEYPSDYLSLRATAAANSNSIIVDHRSSKFDIIKFESSPGYQETYKPTLKSQTEGHQKLVFVSSADNDGDKKYAIDNTPTKDGAWRDVSNVSFLFKFWAFKYPVEGSFPVFVGTNLDVEESNPDMKFRVQKNSWTPLEGWLLQGWLSFHATDQPGDGKKMYTVSQAEDGSSKISEGDCETDTKWKKDFIFYAIPCAEGVEFMTGFPSGVVVIRDSVTDKSFNF